MPRAGPETKTLVLTEKLLNRFRTPGYLEPGRVFEFSHARIPGFKVIVSTKGAKPRTMLFERLRVSGRKACFRLGESPGVSLIEAETEAWRIRATTSRGLDPGEERRRQQAESTTFGEFVRDRYMEMARERKRSWRCDEYRLNRDFLPVWKDRRMTDITPADCLDVIQRIRRRSSGSNANRAISLIKRIGNVAWRLGMVPANPAARLEKYPEPPGRERTLTDQELGALFKALDECDVVSARILRLLACSGLRKNEVCSLQTRFVDLERRSLFLPTTKSGKPRQVPLNDMAVRLLRDQLQHANGSPWLFPAANGKGPRRDVRGTFARACALANISGFHIHDLRHVFASLAVSANCSLPVVARLLGHSRTSAITDRYSHVADATLRAASNTVAEHIAGVISKKQDP